MQNQALSQAGLHHFTEIGQIFQNDSAAQERGL